MLKMISSEALAFQELACGREVETCAAGLVYVASSTSNELQYVVRDFSEVPEDAYIQRTATAAVLKPEYCMHLKNRARAAEAGLLIAHTHPGQNVLEGFSATDDSGERALAEYLHRRAPDHKHFSAVFTASKIYARELGSSEALVSVMLVGKEVILAAGAEGSHEIERFDRQVRALGAAGQYLLASMTVAIVGVGGTGSVVAQQLAYLGIKSFIIIDPDDIEESNLNRVVGAGPSDVGVSKVAIAARMIHMISPDAKVEPIVGDITFSNTAQRLTDVGFIFGCTDSMASRAVMNQLAYQYLVPYIDVGVGIYVRDGRVDYISGRAQMLSPGLPCLVCTDKLDANQVRIEMLSEEARAQDQYIVGEKVIQPAVISLNSTMSSAAITMFLAAVTGFRSNARMLTYDGVRGSLRPAEGTSRAHCIVCSSDGALARGSSWTLPTRSGGSNA